MRGRLIFPFVAELCRLDIAAMETSPTGGYDPDFGEPVLQDHNLDGIDDGERRELSPIRVPCQVEPKKVDDLRFYQAGHSPRTQLLTCFHFRDLEKQGLVHPSTGLPRISIGDRLAALYDKAGELVQAIRTPPGLYATEVRPFGFGLNRKRPRRNLFLVTFESRPLATGRAA